MLARASLASSTEVLASALSALWHLRCSLAVDAEREGTIATVHVTVEGGVFVDGGVARAPSREASRAKPAWVWSPDLLWEHATHGISARAVLDEAILGERAACSVARPDIPAFGALKQPLAALLLEHFANLALNEWLLQKLGSRRASLHIALEQRRAELAHLFWIRSHSITAVLTFVTPPPLWGPF